MEILGAPVYKYLGHQYENTWGTCVKIHLGHLFENTLGAPVSKNIWGVCVKYYVHMSKMSSAIDEAIPKIYFL